MNTIVLPTESQVKQYASRRLPKAFDKSVLKPGDALLYFKNNPMDWAIAVKTWSKIAHIEIYTGGGMSVASRNGVGVNRYALRLDGLASVRRPRFPINLEPADVWFRTDAQGQAYDWMGLMCFTMAVKQGSLNKQFCSEFGTRWYRKAGLQVVDPDWDADRVPPSFFQSSPALWTVWSNGDLF